MLLSTQIQAMLYAFLMGIGYGILFSFKQYISMYAISSLHKKVADIIFHIVFIIVAYFGLYKINGGVSNIYLFIIFFIGTYLYYLLYYDLFLKFFSFIMKHFKPLYKKACLLTIKIYSIMFINKERKKRHGKKRKKKK